MSQEIFLLIFNNSGLQTLLISTGKTPSIKSSSQEYTCFDTDSILDSFKQALDELIPDSSKQPGLLALVLPFGWIDSDGKINKTKNQLISSLCQKFNLKPIGFISADEAILDYFNIEQGVPSSPVLLNIEADRLTVCLTDMGIIKKRLSYDFDSQGNLPQICQNIILKLKDDFSITPKMFVWGQFSRQTVLDFSNYPWIDKDKPDTFLHFPDIIFFNQAQILEIFLDTINSQFINSETFKTDTHVETKTDFLPDEKSELHQSVSDTDTINSDNTPSNKVDASLLGFTNSPPFLTPHQTTPLIVDKPIKFTEVPKKKFKLKLPHLNFRFSGSWIYVIPVLIVFLPAILYIFFYKVEIDVFITPLDIDLKSQVSLDDQTQQSVLDKNIIAVKPDTNTIMLHDEINTTGTKLDGEKAQGKIVIFNKTDAKINISKGQKLKTTTGVSFEFLNDTEVDASSVDFNQGLISMGKTIAVVSATDIGSQGNIIEGTDLLLEDYPQSDILVKAEESFAGGSSRQIQTVSENDTKILSDRIKQKIDQAVAQNQPDQNNKYILPSTTKTKEGMIVFNREIGEEADILSADLETVIVYYSLYSQEESAIFKHISNLNDFNQDIDLDHSHLRFDFIETENLSGNLIITGKASPDINLDKISQQLVFKRNNLFIDILKSNIQRAFDFNLRTNSPFGKPPILPALKQNINLIIKTEL